jgi:hypothetical protein
MSIGYPDENERLVAEQAVTAFREVLRAMRCAPPGQGLATVEAATLVAGRRLVQDILERALSAHPEAQKGGPATGPALASRKRPSRATSASG